MASHWLADLLIMEFDQSEIRKQLQSHSTRQTVAKILDVFFATVFYMNLPVGSEIDTQDPNMLNIWAFVVTMHHFPFANVLHYPTDSTITADFKKKYYLLYQDPRRTSDDIIGEFSDAQRHQLQLWRLLRYAKVGHSQSLFVWRILEEADVHHFCLTEHYIYFLGNDFCKILLAHMKLNTVLSLTEKMLAIASFRDGIERECLRMLVSYYDSIQVDLLDEQKKKENNRRFDQLRSAIEN